MKIEELYQLLTSVVKNAFYGTNEYDNFDNNSLPFIVYQEVSKRANLFSDNKPNYYELTIQVTLVTKNKDLKLEKELENAFLSKDLIFQMITEYRNSDKSVCRVYEVKLEEYYNGE